MRRRIENYAIFYNVQANEGHFIFQLAASEDAAATATLHLDSPQEGSLILDILRNESPVYFDDEHDLIMTGLEEVGEGEA